MKLWGCFNLHCVSEIASPYRKTRKHKPIVRKSANFFQNQFVFLFVMCARSDCVPRELNFTTMSRLFIMM